MTGRPVAWAAGIATSVPNGELGQRPVGWPKRAYFRYSAERVHGRRHLIPHRLTSRFRTPSVHGARCRQMAFRACAVRR